MDRKPSISVIIPVYNRERFLAETIKSVLAQTLPPTEIIVVDDGSTDMTAQVVANLADIAHVPIRYAYQTNQGPAAARNTGLAIAKGDFIAFQDSDDCWTTEKMAVQLSLIQRYANSVAVVGYTQVICEPGTRNVSKKVTTRPGLILLLQASLFRRTLFDLIGGFEHELRIAEDISWFMRVLELPVEIVIHSDIVVAYRRHDDNLTGSLQNSQQQLIMALRHSLSRRRQSRNSPGQTATLIYVTANNGSNNVKGADSV